MAKESCRVCSGSGRAGYVICVTCRGSGEHNPPQLQGVNLSASQQNAELLSVIAKQQEQIAALMTLAAAKTDASAPDAPKLQTVDAPPPGAGAEAAALANPAKKAKKKKKQ